MFEECLKNINTTIEQGKKTVEANNSDWKIFNDVIYAYVNDNKLIISDIGLLSEDIKCSCLYVIYGPNIFLHANNLSNELSKLNIYTIMRGNIKNVDYFIEIESRPYVQLYGIIDNMFSNMSVTTINNIRILPIEYEAISVFYKLYNPVHRCEWENMEKYVEMIEKKIESKNNTRGKNNRNFNKLKHKILNVIIEWLRRREDYILIGKYAQRELTSDKSKTDDNIQIIASGIAVELKNCMDRNKISLDFNSLLTNLSLIHI